MSNAVRGIAFSAEGFLVSNAERSVAFSAEGFLYGIYDPLRLRRASKKKNSLKMVKPENTKNFFVMVRLEWLMAHL